MTPLHHFGDLLRNALLTIPLSVVRLMFVALLLAVCLWVMALPKSAVTAAEATSRSRGANLRVWAVMALLIQIAIYAFL